MNKLTAKYQVKVPSILMTGEEVLKVEPIKLVTRVGEVTIYPPGCEDRQPESYIAPEKGFPKAILSVPGSKLWDADTLWIDVETEATPEFPREEQRKLEREMHELALRFLRLLRRTTPEAPIPLPKSLLPSAVFQWEPPQTGQLVSSGPTTPSMIRVVPLEAGLTKERWEELQQEMSSGVDTELWEDFIIDSKVALDEEDLGRATILAAIASEIFIKKYTQKAAKEKGISNEFWGYLKSRQPKVIDYYDSILHLVKGHSLKTENKQMYKAVERLNQKRNDFMHEGKIPSKVQLPQLIADIQQIRKVISWVREL